MTKSNRIVLCADRPLVLLCLDIIGEASPKAIITWMEAAALRRVDWGYMGPALRLLQRDGMITATQDPRHRQQTYVLTEAGKLVVQQLRSQLDALHGQTRRNDG